MNLKVTSVSSNQNLIFLPIKTTISQSSPTILPFMCPSTYYFLASSISLSAARGLNFVKKTTSVRQLEYLWGCLLCTYVNQSIYYLIYSNADKNLLAKIL